MNKKVFAELTESIKETGAIRQMAEKLQMLGNAALMERPKVAFLSSRKVAPAAVMRCYDWATGMRGSGSAGRLAPPGDGGHAGRVTLPPDFAKCGGGRRVVEAPPRWRLSQSVRPARREGL